MPNPARTLVAQQPGQTTHDWPFIEGTVAAPVPTTFNEPLWVALENAPDRPYGPCKWGAEHGATLPALGALAVLVITDEGRPVVISWDGEHS